MALIILPMFAISSIKRHGLMSWPLLLKHNIPHWPGSSPLSRELDKRKGLANYVRLCCQPTHPMAGRARYEGRIGQYVWLEISDSVLFWRANRYSNDNAVKNIVTIGSDSRIALESSSQQAEVMIEGSLNPRWITFPNDAYYQLEQSGWLSDFDQEITF